MSYNFYIFSQNTTLRFFMVSATYWSYMKNQTKYFEFVIKYVFICFYFLSKLLDEYYLNFQPLFFRFIMNFHFEFLVKSGVFVFRNFELLALFNTALFYMFCS